jgi:hypothetical protein
VEEIWRGMPITPFTVPEAEAWTRCSSAGYEVLPTSCSEGVCVCCFFSLSLLSLLV